MPNEAGAAKHLIDVLKGKNKLILNKQIKMC